MDWWLSPVVTPSGHGTYADVAHLLCDLDLHVAAITLLPSPLAVLGAGAVVAQGLQALVEGRDRG